MHTLLYDLCDHLTAQLRGEEILNCSLDGETSEFVRLNHAAVRQAGSVKQAYLDITLIDGQRQARAKLTITGDPEQDRGASSALLKDLRACIPHLEDDPHLLYSTELQSSEHHGEDTCPRAEEVIDTVLREAEGTDFVGLYAGGAMHAGFANSLGQRNGFSSYNFHLDWSLYHRADKAVKCGYAGTSWSESQFTTKMANARRELSILQRAPRTIEPGRYRVYLAPTAVAEVVSLLSWGSFGLKNHRTQQSPLIRAVKGEEKLASCFSLSENTADGMAPRFGKSGFIKPNRVELFADGSYSQALVSPRSAREYSVDTNGANDQEMPLSLDMAAGSYDRSQVLGELGTGIYVNNLHYLNYSDRPSCRLTGMTRFATFWVENGEIIAPLNVMRFDETLYRMFGEQLVGLTSERELLLDPSTYERRSTQSARVPGAIINSFTFTL
jgi:predicted Zn-dependent protease